MDPKTVEGIPLDASDFAEEPRRDLLLNGIDPNANEDSRPNSSFLPFHDNETESPKSKKKWEPVPPRPMSMSSSIAVKPLSTSMAKSEVKNSEKSAMLKLKKQQQKY